MNKKTATMTIGTEFELLGLRPVANDADGVTGPSNHNTVETIGITETESVNPTNRSARDFFEPPIVRHRFARGIRPAKKYHTQYEADRKRNRHQATNRFLVHFALLSMCVFAELLLRTTKQLI
ncbi:MAG: hypothetical protein HYS44_03450 [Candidatus Niyogibacteria bacterium]|nr:hypothetical protein [Candidatus Niyogibacteria bacterium]